MLKKCPFKGCNKKFRKRGRFTDHYRRAHGQYATWDKP